MQKFLTICVFSLLLVSSFPAHLIFAQTGSPVGGSESIGSQPGNHELTGSQPGNNEKTGSRAGVQGNSATLKNPLDSSISSIPDFFKAVINILMIFAIPFIVFFIIYAGFLYVTARGNAEQIKKAHAALLYALIGGLLILGANVLLTIITGTVSDIVK